ncbi:MAG: hypothetical protein KatS3mg060_2267 [Dehalococcoidia bacterium]|nr:MAG: hypothetical protein KatS3mg060_2267 [Dehalococcoidia bacterium]
MGKLTIVAAIAVAVALVGFSVVARASRPSVERLHLVSMADSAAALQQAGAVMQSHGQTMLAEGQRSGDQDLTAHGQHWLNDGLVLAQRGQWLAMNPLAPSSPGQLTRRALEAGQLGRADARRRGDAP